MQVLVVTVVLCLSLVSLSFQQPPGVPPKGHNQQFQQQQQQQQHGQPQQHADHGQEHGRTLHFSSEVHNADHILEHLQNVVATKKKEDMTEEELEFHYFKLHDYDNNNKLDGVEIGKALTHFHDEHASDQPKTSGHQEGSDGTDQPADGDAAGHDKADTAHMFSDNDLAKAIDAALSMYDSDHDGYIDYVEYKQRRNKHQEREEEK